MLIAGEPSGDLHGAALARELRHRYPDARLIGTGGARMADAGVHLLATLDRMAVMGFVEVAGRLPFFLGLARRLHREIREHGVDLVVPIDYPGFNMRLSGYARRAGVPVLYYIAPQVWAWHRSRMRNLARVTDRLAVILPFEADLFRGAGARATYVGHPLLDSPPVATSREAFCDRLGLDAARPILAVLPGSRSQEVERLLPVFKRAIDLISARSDVQPVLATAESLAAENFGEWPHARTKDSRTLLEHARAALVKSGTGTLEAALAGTPPIIAYRTHPVTYALARRLVQVDHIGLLNLIADERIAPEFVQNEVTPEALAAALEPLLAEATPARQRAVSSLKRVRERLEAGIDGSRGTAARVADLAAEMLAPAHARLDLP